MPGKLSNPAIEQKLANLTNWNLQEGKLHRSLKFKNFVDAFAFMTDCALEAEKMNHHPDWSNSYSTVEINLQTHSSGGITELDFSLALKMEEIAQRLLQDN